MPPFAPTLDTGAVIVDDASGVPKCGFRSRGLAETSLTRWYGEAAEFSHVSSYANWCVVLNVRGHRPRFTLFSTWGEAETWLAHQPPALVAQCDIGIWV